MRKSCKADGPDDLVFQSLKDGKPIRDNNILCRFIKPAAPETGIGLRELEMSANIARNLAEGGRCRREGRASVDEALAFRARRWTFTSSSYPKVSNERSKDSAV